MPSDNKTELDLIYEGAKELFLRGEHDRALERFQCLYEVDCTFRDVAAIVNDYYDTSKDNWIAKYETRFRGQTTV